MWTVALSDVFGDDTRPIQCSVDKALPCVDGCIVRVRCDIFFAFSGEALSDVSHDN